MEAKLDGRVAVITGGSKSIGRAIAAKMAQCGAESGISAHLRISRSGHGVDKKPVM